MEINPYIKDVLRLEADRNSQTRRVESLDADIAWLNAFDVARAAAHAEELEASVKAIDRNTMAAEELGTTLEARMLQARAEAELVIRGHVTEVTALMAQLPSPFNPRHWFRKDQPAVELAEAAKRRLKLATDRISIIAGEAQRDLDRHNEHLSRLHRERARMSENQGHISGHIDRYRALNLNHLSDLRAEALAQIEAIERRLATAIETRDRVEAGLKEIKSTLRDLEVQRRSVEARLAAAVRYEQNLGRALDGASRRAIHEACLMELGDSKPREMIKKAERSLQGIDRDVAKLRDRAGRIVAITSRVINRVVFDGSNLCFRDSKFIGLGAIIAAAEAIAKKKHVIVIFDRSITKRLNTSVAIIKSMFHGAHEVHVVQSKRVADETVLDSAIASDAMVVSNDRFAEFIDKQAKREGRIASHEIVGGRVMIPDLDISESFA